LIILAVFLFPVAVYFLLLGLLNRRPRPVAVPGTWDCAGLLLACSGAILFGGPALITAFYDREVRAWLVNPRWADVPFDELLTLYWLIWLVYLILVITGAALLIWLRSAILSVHNIEPAVFDDMLGQTLDRLGLEWTRLGDRVFIGFGTSSGRLAQAPGQSPAPIYCTQIKAELSSRPSDGNLGAGLPVPSPSRHGEAVFDVESFAATRYVSLVWRSPGGTLRAEIESGVRRALAGVRSPDNPAGTWFLILAAALFLLIFMGVAITILIDIQGRRVR